MLMRHYVIFRSPCRIHTPIDQSVGTGGWVQRADKKYWELLRHLFIIVQLRRTLLLHHSYTMLPVYSSQYCTSEE